MILIKFITNNLKYSVYFHAQMVYNMGVKVRWIYGKNIVKIVLTFF